MLRGAVCQVQRKVLPFFLSLQELNVSLQALGATPLFFLLSAACMYRSMVQSNQFMKKLQSFKITDVIPQVFTAASKQYSYPRKMEKSSAHAQHTFLKNHYFYYYLSRERMKVVF